MIELSQYLSYPVLIIDDEIDKEDSLINRLKTELNNAGIGLLQYNNIPAAKIIQYSNLGAIILDWNLYSLPEGVSTGDELIKANEDSILKFLSEVISNFFIPIIIYSTLSAEEIKVKLDPIINEHPNSLIQVLHKFNIDDFKMAVIEWYKSTATIQVLTHFKERLLDAQNRMFLDYSTSNTDWPKILFKQFTKDRVNPDHELMDVLLKNLSSRIININFQLSMPSDNNLNSDKDTMIKVFEKERYISNVYLDPDSLYTGDLFDLDGVYYLNIRPNCDCIARNCSVDEMEAFLIKGRKQEFSSSNWKNCFYETGSFKDTDNSTMLYPINNGQLVKFKFLDLSIKKFSEIRNNRCGRILPPYIIRIQQRFSAYLQRQGLTSLPLEIISG